MIKAAAVGVTGAALALLLKKSMPELAFLLSCATAAVILLLALDGYLGISGFLSELVSASGLTGAEVSPVIKTVGIGLITKLSSDACRDAGQSTAGAVVETAGTVAGITVALPLMRTVFGMISSLI